MSKRPAKTLQADIARAIRAAKEAGAHGVEIKPDGTILIRLKDLTSTEPPEMPDGLEEREGRLLF